MSKWEEIISLLFCVNGPFKSKNADLFWVLSLLIFWSPCYISVHRLRAKSTRWNFSVVYGPWEEVSRGKRRHQVATRDCSLMGLRFPRTSPPFRPICPLYCILIPHCLGLYCYQAVLLFLGSVSRKDIYLGITP